MVVIFTLQPLNDFRDFFFIFPSDFNGSALFSVCNQSFTWTCMLWWKNVLLAFMW